MSHSPTYLQLDRDAIVSLIRTQQLKRWWVAEFTGVHKTTLRRWLSGRITRVHRERVLALAKLLSVENNRIVRRDIGLDCE